MPERRIQRHGTRLSSVHAALDPQFPPGTRVITPEGLTGRVLFVDDSFSPGNTAYQVQLDSNMGGGTYLGSQLRAVPAGFKGGPGYSNLPASIKAASLDEVEADLELHTADLDYPEMGTILQDRPDPATQFRMIGHYKKDDPYDRDDPDSHNYGWCHAHNEHHDSDAEAEEHEGAVSDWRHYYKHLPGQIYRGMALKLPQAVHEYVHDKSVPAGQRAAALSAHLGEHGGNLGTHWTITKNQARHYAEVGAHHWTGSYSKTDPSITHVVIHADKPRLRDIERDPDTLAENQVLSYDSHEDAEVPLQSQAPVRMRGLSWKRDDERDPNTYPDPTSWNEHMFRPAHEHIAAAEPDYYVRPDEIGYLGARDYYETPLHQRPWEHGNDPEAFQRKVDSIKETAQHEGIHEPVEILNRVLHDGAHRWEAARQLGIELPIRRIGSVHEATEIYGVPIDEQGDAPEHGLVPRSEDPNSYDSQSTEGDQDPEQNDDPWMKSKDQPSQSGNIGPDGIQGTDAGDATGAGGVGGYGPGGGAAVASLRVVAEMSENDMINHMIEFHGGSPEDFENEHAMRDVHQHMHTSEGLDEAREWTPYPHTHHDFLEPWENRHIAPQAPASMRAVPGPQEWADYAPEPNEVATKQQHMNPAHRGLGPLMHTLSSLQVVANDEDLHLKWHMVHDHHWSPDQVENADEGENYLQHESEHQERLDHIHEDNLAGWNPYEEPTRQEQAAPWHAERHGPFNPAMPSSYSSLQSEGKVPWTSKERDLLHRFPYPTATYGDFVPSYDFQDANQHRQHADNVEAQESEAVTSGSLAGRAEALRVTRTARRHEAASERQWELHLRQKHGWTDDNFRRLREQGDRPSDMHSALHEARLANHHHPGGPDEEDHHIQQQMEEERVRNAFGPKMPVPGPKSRFRYKHHDELPHDPDKAVLQNQVFTSPELDMWHAGTTPLQYYSAREDDLYRHMRQSHGFTPEHLNWIRTHEDPEMRDLEGWHHVDHHEYSGHDPEDIHSPYVHTQYAAAPGESEHPDWKIPGAIPESLRHEWSDSQLGGSTRPGMAGELIHSRPMGHEDLPNFTFVNSLDPSPRAYLESVIGVGRNVADEVYKQLSKDYPPEAIDWVQGTKWTGPEHIPLDQIDWANKHSWTASHEPKRVDKFEKKIKKKIGNGEHAKPMIGVARPDAGNVMIADGHHRGLAYEKLDQPAWGYVAHPDMDEGPWDEMHAQQLPEDESGDEFGDDEKHSTPMDQEGPEGADAPGQDDKQAGGDLPPGKLPPGQQPVFAGPPLTQSSTQGHKDHIPAMKAWDTAAPGGGGDPEGTDDSDSGDDSGPPSKKDKSVKKAAALYAFEAAADSPSFAFHFTAAWRDVVAKAKRIRSSGGVRITASTGGLVIGQVRGDHDVYESGIQRVPGKPRSIQHWACGCPWASWHQDKSYPGHLNGRPCSHVWALQLEATARQSSNESRGITRTDPAISMPYSEVVVKSLGPWTNGGWAQVWTAPSTHYPVASLRLAVSDDPDFDDPDDDTDLDYYDTPDGNSWKGTGVYALLAHEKDLHGSHPPPAITGPGSIEIIPLKEAAGILVSAGMRRDEVEALIIMTADQANAPWGGQSVPKEQPQKPFGATEPPQPDMDPAQYGFLNAPDPENWGAIDDSATQMPLTTDGAIHRVECSECGGQVEGTNGPGTSGRCRSCGQEMAIPRFRGMRQDKAYPIVREDPVNITGLSSEDDSFLREHGIEASLQVTADPTAVMVSPTYVSPQPQSDSGVAQWHEDQSSFPYVNRDNTAGPSTSITPRDPNGIRFEESARDWGFDEVEVPGDEDWHPDEFAWKPQRYVAPARDLPGLMDHMSTEHGVRFSGDGHPAPRFLHGLHEKFHSGELPDRPLDPSGAHDHQHDMPEGHDPIFGALQRALAEVSRQLPDPNPKSEHPTDCTCPSCEYDKQYSKHKVADLSDEAPALFGALAGELKDEPEGALDEDGLTAGDTPMGGGSTGSGTTAPSALDTAALGEFGAARREQMRARFGFNPVTHDVDPAGGYALDPGASGGGPGMSQHDEDLSAWQEPSIQTIGEAQWSGAGADSDEVAVPAGQPSGSEAQIIAAFQASAAAKHFTGGGAGAAGDGDIAAHAREFLKTGVLSDAEAHELIAEGKGTRARNLDLLDLEGTHYEAEAAAMKRRGLDLDDFDDDLVTI